MRRRKTWRSAIIAAACSAVMAGLPAQADAGVDETGSESQPVENGVAMAREADRVNALGMHRGDDGSVLVRLQRGSTAKLHFPQDEPRARAAKSRFTHSDISGLTAALSDRNWTSTARTFRYAFGYSAEFDAVEVHTDADAATRAALVSRFGDQIILRDGDGPGRTAGQRNIENTSPHYGAAYIRQGGAGGFTELCTSGFAIKVGTQLRMVTANHCFRDTVSLYGRDVEAAGSPYYYGTLEAQPPAFPTYEFQAMSITNNPSTYAGRIWTGGPTSQTSARVTGAGDACLNCSPYWFSGGVSGEKTGGQVRHTSYNYCDQDGCTPGSLQLTGLVLQNGDSGAPLYAKAADGTVSIRGVSYAQLNGYFYAEKWSTVATKYSATIVTG